MGFGDKGRCRSCGAAIVWIRREGKSPLPVDDVPKKVLVADDGAFVSGRPSHFGTCPHADQHRKPKASEP